MVPERDTWQWISDGAQVATPIIAILVVLAAYLLSYLRRPSVYLEGDTDRIQSWLEGTYREWPHLRLLACNKGWRRVAHGTRVIVEGYRKQGEPVSEMRTLGSPLLGWPSMRESPDGGLSIPPGLKRPVDVGSLFPVDRNKEGLIPTFNLPDGSPAYMAHRVRDGGRWEFKLGLAFGLTIADQREFLQADGDGWIVRVTIAADDGSAKTYDVHIAWEADEADPKKALDSMLDHLAIERV